MKLTVTVTYIGKTRIVAPGGVAMATLLVPVSSLNQMLLCNCLRGNSWFYLTMATLHEVSLLAFKKWMLFDKDEKQELSLQNKIDLPEAKLLPWQVLQ